MARGSVGSFFVEYRATADKFLADLKQMAKDASEFDKTLKPLRERATDIGKAMSIAGGAVTGAFVAMAKQAADYGDQIRDASIRTGVGTQALSGLKLQAEQSGASFESLNGILMQMSRAALATAQGSKESAKGFSAIGVSVKDAAGNLRPMEAILGDVADRFQKLPDGIQKAGVAQQLFGRNGAVMIEFLNQGKAGLQAFQNQAEELGIVIGDDAAAAADSFNDSLNLLKQAQLGLSVTIGNMLLPALTKLVSTFTSGIIAFRKFTEAHPELTRAIFVLSGAILGTGGLLLGLSAVLAIAPKVGAAFTLMTGPIGLATGAIALFVGALYAFPKLRGFVGDFFEKIISDVFMFGSALASLAKGINQLGQRNFSQAWETFAGLVERAEEAGRKAGNSFQTTLADLAKVTDIFNSSVSAAGPPLEDLSVDLNVVSDDAAKLREKLFELSNFLRGAESNLEAPIARFAKNSIELLNQLGSAADSLQVKLGAIRLAPLFSQLEMIDAPLESNARFRLKIATDEAAIAAARDKENQRAIEALKNATEDVKRSAGKIFDDMFIRGENVFSSLKNLLKGGALSLGRAIFEDVTGALLGPIKKAFDDFFKGLLDKTVGSFVKGLGSKLGSVLGDISGTSGGAIKNAVGGASSVGGAAGSVAGGAASLTGSLISGGLAFAGSVVGALITKGNAKRTEENTRESRDWLELQTVAWNPLFHKMTFFQEGMYASLNALAGVRGNGRTAPASIAAVSPSGGGNTVNAPFTLNLSVNVELNNAEMNDIEVRDELMPKITTILDTGLRGYREKWRQIFTGDDPGTAAVVGI